MKHFGVFDFSDIDFFLFFLFCFVRAFVIRFECFHFEFVCELV